MIQLNDQFVPVSGVDPFELLDRVPIFWEVITVIRYIDSQNLGVLVRNEITGTWADLLSERLDGDKKVINKLSGDLVRECLFN